MRVISGIGSVAIAMLAACWAQPGLAQGNCGDIQLSGELGTRFPNARNACLDVVERNGEKYAHFKARITRIRGGEVQAEFRQPDGTWGRPVSFNPSSNARVRIQGRTYRYSELTPNQELDVYLPEGRWALAVHEDPNADFLTAQTVQEVPLADPPAQLAAALPRTASVVPLFGALGALLTTLGLGAAVLRRRLRAAA